MKMRIKRDSPCLVLRFMPLAAGEIVAEEVVVESSLNVRNPSVPINRRVRSVNYYLMPDTSFTAPVRAKRQLPNQGFGQFPNQAFGQFPNQGFGQFPNSGYDSSQSTAQSASNSNSFSPFGSQNAAALAGAQAFQTTGPLGSFGATANNANTNTLSITPNGSTGGVSNAGGQTYNLPNGQSINLAYNNGFSVGPNGRPSTSQGSSISIAGTPIIAG